MDSKLKNKLYNLEVNPPAAVWEKLSASLNEINADLALAEKIKNTAIIPPAGTWENIRELLSGEKEKDKEANGFIFYFKRFAAAAVLIGIIIAAWTLIRNNTRTDNSIVSKQTSQEEKRLDKPETPSPPTEEPQKSLPLSAETKENETNPVIAKQTRKSSVKKNIYQTLIQSKPENENVVAINKQKPGEKIFTPTVDDLAIVGDGEHYMTMLNANGRLVKISPQLAHLAPRLQDKPVTEDLYEIMFGEGEYWKETLSDWRKQLALSTATSGDGFSSLIELLKTVSNK